MLPSLAGEATDTITRAQLILIEALSDQISLSPEQRRRALNLTQLQWRRWTDFLADGPLPADPPLPEMLRRIGKLAHHLALQAELVA